MKLWFSLLSVLLVVMIPFTEMAAEQTEVQPGHQSVLEGTRATNDHHMGHITGGWEGSAEGKAYSEFNHHFAGFCNTLLGLAELGNALQYPLPLWTRLVLPAALGTMGVYLFIWSDHDAWPIGTLSFMESFFGEDREIVEHKFYGVLAVLIAVVEAFRRTGRLHHPAWAAPLIFSALIAGLLLFVHSHGDHPATAKIELHHALLGSVAVGAALSKAMASWMPGASWQFVKWADVAWAGSVILSGLLLLVYSE
ncbi:MAG: hypothetical protein KF693_05400 [Nitrospira sp.]|nr:hypothetical protein [Nitrospira sp.]